MAIEERYERYVSIVEAARDVFARRPCHQALHAPPTCRWPASITTSAKVELLFVVLERSFDALIAALDTAVVRAGALAGQPLGAVAERWKEADPGGRAVAVYPMWVPAEIIAAAGTPLAFLGAGSSVGMTHADACCQSFVCSIAKSSRELSVSGGLTMC